MKTLQTQNFSLQLTLESGQYFLYQKINDFYYITTPNEIIKIKQENNTLHYEGISQKELKNFFNLNHPLNHTHDFHTDKYLTQALNQYQGIHIINQDLWLATIAFICSACSNIPKITKNLNLICQHFGKKIIFDNKEFYLFPQPGQINNYETLIECKTGYRAKYIYNLNQKILKNPNLLNQIKTLPYEKAHHHLIQLQGIGNKVADCICLYALNHHQAFPIDTWIKQTLEQLYLNNQKTTPKQLTNFVNKKFPHNKGIKQQYLFHWARHNLKNKK